jgi:hypothetical protein
VKIIAPPGYARVVPFDRDRHRGLGRKASARYAFARTLHSIYITAHEFIQAARCYPLVFGTDPASDERSPMALMSLQAGRNLFVDAQGEWRPGTYIPAYVRRYPLCLAQVKRAENTPPEPLVCVDEAGLSADASAWFEDTGKPGAEWQREERFLRDYEAARRRTAAFVEVLKRHDLL